MEPSFSLFLLFLHEAVKENFLRSFLQHPPFVYYSSTAIVVGGVGCIFAVQSHRARSLGLLALPHLPHPIPARYLSPKVVFSSPSPTATYFSSSFPKMHPGVPPHGNVGPIGIHQTVWNATQDASYNFNLYFVFILSNIYFKINL